MLLVFIVFVGVFAVAALLIAATGVDATERARQTLQRLDAVVARQQGIYEDIPDFEKKEVLSAIPLVSKILQHLEVGPQLRLLLYQANVKWTPGGFLLVSFALWMAGTYAFFLRSGNLFFSLLVGLIPAFGPLSFVARKRASRFLKFEERLPAALDLMVSGIRGGQSLTAVLGLVAKEAEDPVGPEFRICFDEQNFGLEMRAALENLANRVPIQDVRIVMTAILVQRETGGNLAEVLDKCAHLIRERFRIKREIRTKTAQGRLTGWILSLLPPGLGTVLYLLQPDLISLLWRRPFGVKMLYAGAFMITMGSLIIRKIVRIRV